MTEKSILFFFCDFFHVIHNVHVPLLVIALVTVQGILVYGLIILILNFALVFVLEEALIIVLLQFDLLQNNFSMA
jgi:hypothetical protein